MGLLTVWLSVSVLSLLQSGLDCHERHNEEYEGRYSIAPTVSSEMYSHHPYSELEPSSTAIMNIEFVRHVLAHGHHDNFHDKYPDKYHYPGPSIFWTTTTTWSLIRPICPTHTVSTTVKTTLPTTVTVTEPTTTTVSTTTTATVPTTVSTTTTITEPTTVSTTTTITEPTTVSTTTTITEPTTVSTTTTVTVKTTIYNGYTCIKDLQCYKVLSTMEHYKKADEACQLDGGHVVIINSQAELDAIVALIPSGGTAWLGLTDLDNEGTILTSLGGPLSGTFQNWAGGVPDNTNDKDCVLLFQATADMAMNHCGVAVTVICEIG